MNKQELEQFEKSAVDVCSQATRKLYKDFQLAGYDLSGIELKKYGTIDEGNYQSEIALTIYQHTDGTGNLIPIDWVEELICLNASPRYTLDGIKKWIDEQLQEISFELGVKLNRNRKEEWDYVRPKQRSN
jgi:hypothetical protein